MLANKNEHQKRNNCIFTVCRPLMVFHQCNWAPWYHRDSTSIKFIVILRVASKNRNVFPDLISSELYIRKRIEENSLRYCNDYF